MGSRAKKNEKGEDLVAQPTNENKMGVMPENKLLLNMALRFRPNVLDQHNLTPPPTKLITRFTGVTMLCISIIYLRSASVLCTGSPLTCHRRIP